MIRKLNNAKINNKYISNIYSFKFIYKNNFLLSMNIVRKILHNIVGNLSDNINIMEFENIFNKIKNGIKNDN